MLLVLGSYLNMQHNRVNKQENPACIKEERHKVGPELKSKPH